MGFLEDLAALAIRGQVIAALRAECPAALKESLEKLLGDAPAIAAIQGAVMQCMKGKTPLTAGLITSLPLSGTVKELLAAQPALTEFLVSVANAKMPR